MNKILGYFLFGCALIFNANLIYSSDVSDAGKIRYLKANYKKQLPKIMDLTTSNAKSIISDNKSVTNENGETLLELVSGLDEFQSEKGGKHLRDIKGDLRAVQYLIELGADPNIADKHGTTPLMLAALTGRLDIVIYLLSHGADKSLRNKCYNKDSDKDQKDNPEMYNFCSTALDYAKDSLKKYASDSEVAERLRIIIEILTSEPSKSSKSSDVYTNIDKESDNLLDELNAVRIRAINFVFKPEKFSNISAINDSITHKYKADIYDLVNYIDEAEIAFAQSKNKDQLKAAIKNASVTMDFLDQVNGNVGARNTYAQEHFVLMPFLSAPSYQSAINDKNMPSAPAYENLPSYEEATGARG